MAINFKPLILTPVNFSLTAGTQIPAPPDSPPLTPVKADLPTLEEEGGLELGNAAKSTGNGVSTPDSKAAPLSPLSSSSPSRNKRASGVRKFLSLRSLRSESRPGRLTSPKGSYDDSHSRPGSPYTTSTALSDGTNGANGALRHKKSAGWFGTANNRRKSAIFGKMDERVVMLDQEQENKKPKGPPPPTIPEFTLGNELDMGADDLFKNIK